ncbi:hypothetical protein [Candidatus Bodocaedibacter vickermanii]|uniref:Outer membrane protein beta-barrel domain-containing protein n=1 Tax=Candidatus Bodocaedibacter vickermanii TaxID=2741701 RepID=A0A7L9RTG2_9PROT|nr:hypothetical protein CPBP_00684 [Candidatus Paracaedibacteraceae bacterium 'Lake Konstanz']
MKKNLLAAALVAVSLTGVKAESTPTGEGFYVMGQVGGGKLILGEGFKWHKIGADGKMTPKDTADNLLLGWLPSMQYNWGYSHRFANDITLGLEATVISPAVRLGYMLNDMHHFALGVHYGWTSILFMDLNILWNKTTVSKEFDPLCGVGGSFSYEYFTPSKNFFRVQLRVDYYSGKITTNEIQWLPEFNNYPPAVQEKIEGSVLDVYASVGFGSQW